MDADEVFAILLQKIKLGGGSTADIQDAVNNYLNNNPVEAGATAEQAQQIQSNTDSISQIEEELKKVFQSVSNGKEKIASAITDKGIETGAMDTFAIMAQNIREIQTGGEYEFYEGIYNVVPKAAAQVMETKDRVMKDNVTVAEIPFHEVSNQTGTTAIIGGIV